MQFIIFKGCTDLSLLIETRNLAYVNCIKIAYLAMRVENLYGQNILNVSLFFLNESDLTF